MSTVINTTGVTPGSIYRIYLKNFVTYSEVELYPGKTLNLIIGPNGTGKSTFVCAIILGLCGKPNVIGRTSKVSSYIRTNCETATIELELYQEKGMKNVIIKRTINLKEISTWSIDNVAVNESNIQQLIRKFNIQVDNFCQLLPQDRVQNFSDLNPKELLKSTLSAVNGEKSVKILDKLIETGKEKDNLIKSASQTVTRLNNLKRENERLSVEVEAMKRRNEYKERIEICERKKMWLECKDSKDKLKKYESDKKKASATLKACEDKLKPIQNSIDIDQRSINGMEQDKLAFVGEIENIKELIKKTIESVQTKEYEIRDAQSAYQEKVERQNNKVHELSEAKAKLEMLINNKRTLELKRGTESDLQAELETMKETIGRTTAVYDGVKKKYQQIEYQLTHQIEARISLLNKRLNALRDVNTQHMASLQQYSKDTYKAVMWLRENRHLFKHPVHEPMMLVISFEEPKYARFLEATVPARDLVAFTFECKDDMNLFLRTARGALGLRAVNAVCGAGPPARAPAHPPPAHLGFHAYLGDVFGAPPAVHRYLCAAYGLQRIPLGDRHTYENADQVPAHITCFFTEKHKFTVRTSAYSREASTTTFEVRPARLLANTLDVGQINAVDAELKKLENEKIERLSQLNNLQNQLTTLEDQEQHLNPEKNEIEDTIGKIRNLSALIRIQEKKTNEIANERPVDINREEWVCKTKQKDAVKKQCKLHEELIKHFKKLHQIFFKIKILTMKLEMTRVKINEYKSKMRKSESELDELKKRVHSNDSKIRELTLKVNEYLTKLKRICNNKLPTDPDFPYAVQFKELPMDLVQLREHCFELETSRDALGSGDKQDIKQFEANQREIAELGKQEKKTQKRIMDMESSINQLKNQWLSDVKQLIHNVNINFSEMFKRVNCTGEVKLQTGDDVNDFSAYGIGIWVKFRQNGEMMQLSRTTQSGGERTLATALYLLAMQSIVSVPFRCVDEINQGMDTVNERKMIQLLVKHTTDLQNSQYFLLTPKLLRNLEYNNFVMVHTIMNGRELMHYTDWQIRSFMQNARVLDRRYIPSTSRQ